MSTFDIKQNDDLPEFTKQVSPSQTLSGTNVSSVKFHMEDVQSGTVIVDNDGYVKSVSDDELAYDWPNSGTQDHGEYFAEFEVTYSGSKVESFPKLNDQKGWKIKIHPEIA